jgi:hypothetical protein
LTDIIIHCPIANSPPGVRYGSGGRPIEEDGVFTRPIIKEEDLKQLDEIVRDNGWATSDEIDYNQKLAFSDDEGQDADQDRPRTRPMGGQAGGDARSSPGQPGEAAKDERRPASRGELQRNWQQQQQQQQQQQPRVHDFHRQVSYPSDDDE